MDHENTPEQKPEKQTEQPAAKVKKKKKKYKLQPMDIVTIVFTVVIVGIMAYVLYTQFAGNGKNTGDPSTITGSSSPGTAVTPAPTAKPVLSDIGSIYGNTTNDSRVVVVDGREYFISADDAGDKHIFVTVGEQTTALYKANASSLNVITDYITYADQSDVKAYYVFYINGDGKICYLYDGPVKKDKEPAALEEKVFLDGKYQSISVSGEFVYYLEENGHIGKAEIASGNTTELGKERAYRNMTLYYGVVYAIGKEDNLIYSMPSNPSKDADATAAPTAAATGTAEAEKAGEKLLINQVCKNLVIDDDWIYVISDTGITRYMIGGNGKDTLSSVKADTINVYKGKIFYSVGTDLYTASSAEALLLGDAVKTGTIHGGCNVSASAVYGTDEQGRLLKATPDKESGTYGAFTKMN